MTDQKNLNAFPNKHIKPYDGMSITAEIWKEAHDEHRQSAKSHSLVFHGSGILAGLEVLANDPADKLVFISPGAAVDSAGNLVILKETVAFEFGDDSQGELYLIIGHGEREMGGVDNEARYVQDEFVVAALPEIPKRPNVEIARIRIDKENFKVTDAKNPRQPEGCQLDLRFRNSIAPRAFRTIKAGLVNLGGKFDQNITSGWNHLGSMMERGLGWKLVVDSHTEVINNLDTYDMVYLSSKSSFKLSKTDQEKISKYYDSGKPLFLEALEEKAEESCQAVLEALSLEITEPEAGSALLTGPYLFRKAPDGFRGNSIFTGSQVLYSTAGYALAWAAVIKFGDLNRENIRAAHEFGCNLVEFLLRD